MANLPFHLTLNRTFRPTSPFVKVDRNIRFGDGKWAAMSHSRQNRRTSSSRRRVSPSLYGTLRHFSAKAWSL